MMEDLLERLDRIAYLIGCEATHYGAEIVEEVMNTLYEAKETIANK